MTLYLPTNAFTFIIPDNALKAVLSTIILYKMNLRIIAKSVWIIKVSFKQIVQILRMECMACLAIVDVNYCKTFFEKSPS